MAERNEPAFKLQLDDRIYFHYFKVMMMHTKFFLGNYKDRITYKEDKMNNLDSWRIFESTGKVEDYLKYAQEKKVNEARENFISKVEGDKNGRDDYGSGNGNFRDSYK